MRISKRMKAKFSEMAIAKKLKEGKSFEVPSDRERRMAYAAAKYLGLEIKAKANKPGDGFTILVFT